METKNGQLTTASCGGEKKEEYILEGPIKRYRGVITGYKSCFARIIEGQQVLVLTKESAEKKALDGSKVDRIRLEEAKVTCQESSSKLKKGSVTQQTHDQPEGGQASSDTSFTLTHQVNGKPQKLYLKANTVSEKNQWVHALRVATGEVKEDDKVIELFQTLSQKLLVEEQSMGSIMVAFKGIEMMLKEEIRTLDDQLNMLASTEHQEMPKLQKKIRKINDLSKTMGGLMRNIIHEVHRSRDDMLRDMDMLDHPQGAESMRGQIADGDNDETSPSKRKSRKNTAAYESSDSDNDEDFKDAHDGSDVVMTKTEVRKADISSKLFNIVDVQQERLCLPHLRNPNQKIGVIQLLKDVIGKDLSKITLPVYFNEPLSITQKAAESTEYIHILKRAALEKDQYKRIALVAAYNTSRLSSIKDRTLKPFNSLLGETFELVTEEFRFVSEQVCHHPPVTAFHVESPYYEQYSCQANTAKFNGRYVIIAPKNHNYVNLKLPDGTVENYYWTVPQTVIHNIIIGKIYIDLRGQCLLKNNNTGDVCEMDWKERSWNGKNAHSVEGLIKNKYGESRYKMSSVFTEYAKILDLSDPNAQEEFVYRLNPRPDKCAENYNFGLYTLQLNYLTPELKSKIPHTDSRLRPDQRAYENGDSRLAAALKDKLEVAQRARRKQHDQKGTTHMAGYFALADHPITGERYWKFNGKYWEDRQNQDWSRLANIFEDEQVEACSSRV